jgi:hypothetical protein
MEDERRRRVTSAGRVEALCTLCEIEARPYVHADDEYVVASTLTGEEKRITVCRDHADQLSSGKLPYLVVRRRKGVDWDHPL